jgi:hypothetical protein
MTKTTLPVRRGTGGRPRYSDAVRKKLLTGLRTGMTRAAAAGFAGVARETFYDWIDKDPEGFGREVKIAEDYAEARYTSTISSSLRAQGEGVRLRAAEFWLDRRRPEAWREKSSIEITLPPEVQEASRSDDELRDEIRRVGEELVRRGSARTGSRASGGAPDQGSS